MIVLNPLQVAGLDRELAARDGDPLRSDPQYADPTFAPEALIREAQAVRVSAETGEPFGAVAEALRDPPVAFFAANPANVGRPLTVFDKDAALKEFYRDYSSAKAQREAERAMADNINSAITISSSAPVTIKGLPPPETASEELAAIIRSIEAQNLTLRIFLVLFVGLAAVLMAVWLGWRL